MQVEATKNEGLTRQFSVTIPAQDIETKVTARLNEIGATVSMPGFRPGKVPLQILKKQYGPSVIGEVLEREISETSAEAIKDNNLRPAMQPRVEIVGFEEGSDLTYTMTLELMPEFEQPDFKKIKLERLVVDVTDDMASEALARIAEEQKAYDTVSDDRPSTAADALLVDFTGTMDGTEFPGGSAKDFQLELSSQNFIPGFIDQMVGVKAGEAREIKVTFPDDYGAAELAGKEATFSVTVKELRAPKAVEVNDELAKGMGLESLDAMKAAVKERLASEYGSIARMRLKRGLLDHMAEEATFEVPRGMVEPEFQQI
jgi:trigger factor